MSSIRGSIRFMSEACHDIREVYIVNLGVNQAVEDRIRNVLHEEVTVHWIHGEDCVEQMLDQLIDRGMFHGESFVESFNMQPKIT